MIVTARETTPLDDALADSFPASDPPAMTSPLAATPAHDQVAVPDAGGLLRIYRVIEPEHAAQPFAPSDNGGRWSSPGVECVYAALSPATAMLEYLAHLEGRTPGQLLLAVGAIPAGAVRDETNLPSTWCDMPYRGEVRQIGDAWIESKRSLGLRVPSALCDGESNLLLNPRHPAYAVLEVQQLRPLRIDERIRT
jgi:RES domain-containing protein